MCFLVKQTKLYHTVIIYAVLSVNFIALAQNRSTELDTKLNSTESRSFPLYLAKAIENATVLANLSGLKATKFGFLYLHGRSNHVQFDNGEVKSKLGPYLDKQGYSYPITFYPDETFSTQPSMYNQFPSQNESQPQNTNDYQPPALQFVAKDQNLPQTLAENESTPSSSDLRDDFHGQNLSEPQDIPQEYNQSVSWQSAISTDLKSSPVNSYDAFNSNPTRTQEVFQNMPASSLWEQESNQEGLFRNTTQYNATQEEYSRDYQNQEPLGSATPQQASFHDSAGTIPNENPLAPEQSLDETINQNTTQVNATEQYYHSPVYQQQNYYDSVYQQQQEHTVDTTPLRSVLDSSTAEDPKPTSEQTKFINAEPQQKYPLQQEETQQSITEAQQNSFLNSIGKLQEQRLEQNPIQGNYDERYLQKNSNESISMDQQNVFKNVATPQLTQSAREEKFIQGSESKESSVDNTTNLQSKQELRSFNQNETEKHSSITNKHLQNEMLFSEEQNKQYLPQENKTNTKYTEQNFFKNEKDQNIIQSLLSADVSQFRNEYELAAQKVKDTNMLQPGYQQTYERFPRENKGRNLFTKTDVQAKKNVIGKHLRKLFEKNQAKLRRTLRLKRMINKLLVHNESDSKPTFFDKLLNNPSETNFLMLPSTESNNKHHKSQEHGLLMKLEAMRHTFLEKHNECPSYVIFGTNSESCFTLTTDKDNCAEELMEIKEMFKQGCAQTLFYIYVRKDKTGKVHNDDVQGLIKNGINVLIPE